MPMITSKLKGQTLFNQFTFSMSPTELAVAKASNAEDFIYKLTTYLDGGHDLTAPISILFSMPIDSGITINNPSMEMVCTFKANATFAHYVAYEIAAYDITELNFLKEYNIDWNQNFEFSGSYNGFTPFDGTPLHLAAFEAEHKEIIEFFIEMDAQPNILNSQNQTALDIAQEIGFPEVSNFLQQYINENPDLQESLTFAEYLDAKAAYQSEDLMEVGLYDVLEGNDTIPGLEESTPQESSYFYQAYEAVSDYISGFFNPVTVDITPANELIG